MRKILVFGVLFWGDQLILEIEKFVCEWHRNTKITFQSIKSVKTLNNTFTMWGNLYWGSSTLHYFEIGKRYHVTLFNSLKITTRYFVNSNVTCTVGIFCYGFSCQYSMLHKLEVFIPILIYQSVLQAVQIYGNTIS